MHQNQEEIEIKNNSRISSELKKHNELTDDLIVQLFRHNASLINIHIILGVIISLAFSKWIVMINSIVGKNIISGNVDLFVSIIIIFGSSLLINKLINKIVKEHLLKKNNTFDIIKVEFKKGYHEKYLYPYYHYPIDLYKFYPQYRDELKTTRVIGLHNLKYYVDDFPTEYMYAIIMPEVKIFPSCFKKEAYMFSPYGFENKCKDIKLNFIETSCQ